MFMNARRNCGALAFLFLLGFVLCGSASSQSGTAAYPPADQIWSEADYKRAADIVKAGQMSLPRLADAETKRIFERMVSLDNFAFADDTSLSVQSRAIRIANMMQYGRQFMLSYMKAVTSGEPLDLELSKLLVHSLKVAAKSIPMSQSMLKSIPRDEKYAVRAAGFEQWQRGLRQIFAGTVLSITETNVYSTKSQLELIRGVSSQLSAYKPILSQADRDLALSHVGGQIDKTTDPEIKAALTRLKAELSEAR